MKPHHSPSPWYNHTGWRHKTLNYLHSLPEWPKCGHPGAHCHSNMRTRRCVVGEKRGTDRRPTPPVCCPHSSAAVQGREPCALLGKAQAESWPRESPHPATPPPRPPRLHPLQLLVMYIYIYVERERGSLVPLPTSLNLTDISSAIVLAFLGPTPSVEISKLVINCWGIIFRSGRP